MKTIQWVSRRRCAYNSKVGDVKRKEVRKGKGRRERREGEEKKGKEGRRDPDGGEQKKVQEKATVNVKEGSSRKF